MCVLVEIRRASDKTRILRANSVFRKNLYFNIRFRVNGTVVSFASSTPGRKLLTALTQYLIEIISNILNGIVYASTFYNTATRPLSLVAKHSCGCKQAGTRTVKYSVLWCLENARVFLWQRGLGSGRLANGKTNSRDMW
jgi:hypothetical protein